MAVHMGLGLLFLGGGAYTLRTDNKAVAALLLALYPTFPSSSSDNKFHMQAFRHVWVLAAERRCLVTRDVETRQVVAVPIEITTVTDEDTKSAIRLATTPCLLPEINTIKSIKIASPRYWQYEIDVAGDAQQREKLCSKYTLVVKRRTGYLDYMNVC
jgi:anaphase-promoting complex subunit 1